MIWQKKLELNKEVVAAIILNQRRKQRNQDDGKWSEGQRKNKIVGSDKEKWK